MTDLIDRQTAINAVNCGALSAAMVYGRTDEGRVALYETVKAIKALPSAQQKQRWIPCSERLPEKPNVYTVTDSKGDVVRFVFYNNESSRKYWKRCAKAWMPLPEPYKEGEKDDN